MIDGKVFEHVYGELMGIAERASGHGPTVPPALDSGRLEAMYRAHHVVIWRTLRRMGYSAEAAADYTHQAYLIAAERLAQIHYGSEKAYLFSTAIRFAKTAARKDRRIDLPGELPEKIEHSELADGIVNRQVALQLLERVLRPMDEDLVVVFSLFEIEGLSSPEIAEILDIPLGTVASRLRRARQAFRQGAARLERRGCAVSAEPVDEEDGKP